MSRRPAAISHPPHDSRLSSVARNCHSHGHRAKHIPSIVIWHLPLQQPSASSTMNVLWPVGRGRAKYRKIALTYTPRRVANSWYTRRSRRRCANEKTELTEFRRLDWLPPSASLRYSTQHRDPLFWTHLSKKCCAATDSVLNRLLWRILHSSQAHAG